MVRSEHLVPGGQRLFASTGSCVKNRQVGHGLLELIAKKLGRGIGSTLGELDLWRDWMVDLGRDM